VDESEIWERGELGGIALFLYGTRDRHVSQQGIGAAEKERTTKRGFGTKQMSGNNQRESGKRRL